MSDALAYWLGFVGVMTLWGAAQGTFLREQMRRTQFARQPHQVTPSMGRTFATWVTLAGYLRVRTALDLENRPLFDVCHASFVAVLVFYAYETFVAKTTSPRVMIAPFVVSGISFAWMTYHRVFNWD